MKIGVWVWCVPNPGSGRELPTVCASLSPPPLTTTTPAQFKSFSETLPPGLEKQLGQSGAQFVKHENLRLMVGKKTRHVTSGDACNPSTEEAELRTPRGHRPPSPAAPVQ